MTKDGWEVSKFIWDHARGVARKALETGAIQPIATSYRIVEESNVLFLVRVIDNLRRKDAVKPKSKGDKNFNPFLPYEKELWVADVGESHVVLLNKFNVMDQHLLIVTRHFEEQESLLHEDDFLALCRCMGNTRCLAFYNGGKIAGASQPHKHLQLVPLPFLSERSEIPEIPILPLLWKASFENEIGSIPDFHFCHAFARLDAALFSTSIEKASKEVHHHYRMLLKSLGANLALDHQSFPYNLLLTQSWMLIVKRSLENFGSISMNSINFAGAFLVRDQEQFQEVQKHGPLSVLHAVAEKAC